MKTTIGEPMPPISVPTESRRPNRLCSNCGVELFANYQEAGWNHCTREMKPFGNGCKFDGLFACAGKCQCPANTEMLGEFAASSSLLPVRQQIDIQELRLEGKGTDHIWLMEDGAEPHTIGIRLDSGDSGVVYVTPDQAKDLAEQLTAITSVASLPVGESRQGEGDASKS